MSGWGRGLGRGMGMRGPPVREEQPPLPPPAPDAVRVGTTTDSDMGLNSPVSFRFARAPFLLIVDVKDGRVIDIKCIQNPYSYGGGGVGVAVGQWMISSRVSLILASRLGPNIGMVLNQAGIGVEIVPPGIPVGEALRRLGLLYGE